MNNKHNELQPLNGWKKIKGPVVTIIMDGLGLGPRDASDGVYMAYTPVFDSLMEEELTGQLKAHGTAVGLPTDQDMGNSEVGHNALGAGRVFSQGAKLVEEAFESGSIFETSTWQTIVQRSENGVVHFIGLVSDGNVHSHISHLYAMLNQAVAEGISKVRVHALLDGRDVEQKSALDYIVPLEETLAALSVDGRDYRIASGGGRMVVTMDRYGANWSVVEKGWQAHVLGEAAPGRFFATAAQAVEASYAEDSEMTDQYMDSFVIVDDNQPVGTIEDGDSVIFFNFRGDRAIEISEAFEEEGEFSHFDRKRFPEVFYAGMMQYDGDALIPKNFLVQPPKINRTLGEYLCGNGVRSYAISETQKFGHVTYFWNGNKLGYIDERLEKYEEVLSDTVTFDLRPWMKAEEITEKVIAAIDSGEYSFIRLNYANADMVGHTGVEAAVRIAVETVDLCLGRVLAAVKRAGGIALVTADHGNADCMWTEKNGRHMPMVSHTLNPVPFIIKDYSGVNQIALCTLESAGLTNVAATICNLLGFTAPQEYDPSLVVINSND